MLAAVVQYQDKILLARNAAWTHKMYALITGFMEAGETPLFCNDTETTEIYTLSLHDALPICAIHASARAARSAPSHHARSRSPRSSAAPSTRDRKSTRLNSSHANISYAV